MCLMLRGQGLTFLRLQRIHLMEPNPLGWSKVVQTIGRGIRRGTHEGMSEAPSGVAAQMRSVETIIYTTVSDEQVLARLREDQRQQIAEEERELREAYVAKVHQLREVKGALLAAAFPSASFEQRSEKKEQTLGCALEKLSTKIEKLNDEQKKASPHCTALRLFMLKCTDAHAHFEAASYCQCCV